MEIISELPCGFLDELNLDNDRKNVLLEQINRFNRLSEIKISNKDIKLDILGNIIFYTFLNYLLLPKVCSFNLSI